MPSLLMVRLFGGLALLGVLWGGIAYIKHTGYVAGVAEQKIQTDKAQRKYDDLTAKIAVADAQVRADKLKQEQDNAKIQKRHDDEVVYVSTFYASANSKQLADARATYERLLHAGDQASGSSSAINPEGNAGAASEPAVAGCNPPIQSITGCPVEVEARCAKDATRVNWYRDFLITHQFPVD